MQGSYLGFCMEMKHVGVNFGFYEWSHLFSLHAAYVGCCYQPEISLNRARKGT